MTAGPGGGAEDQLDVTLRALRCRARARNAARVDEVVRLLGHGHGPGAVALPSAEAVLEAAALCHAVAGSAGTFGDDATSDAARAVETALRTGDAGALAPPLRRLRALTRDTGDGSGPGS